MLHKCANPACLSPFRKLSQGKLFLVEAEARERLRSRRANRGGQPSHRIEYYWLCDQCAFVLTLVVRKGARGDRGSAARVCEENAHGGCSSEKCAQPQK